MRAVRLSKGTLEVIWLSRSISSSSSMAEDPLDICRGLMAGMRIGRALMMNLYRDVKVPSLIQIKQESKQV